MGDFIYLDYNATTPVDPKVAEAMGPFLTGYYGNPSSTHRLGRQARASVEHAREQVAACLGCLPEEITFTSGGTESDNLAIRGVVTARGGGHVITTAIEHPAVLEVVRELERRGRIQATYLPVDPGGRVRLSDVQRALRPDTILVSVMLANNEVGTLQPLREIAALCRERGITCHTDAAQAVGKIPVDVRELGIDLLTVAGHKLYAPKGIGALYIRSGTAVAPVLLGAGHEAGLRPGTENILEQVGLGAACQRVVEEGEAEFQRIGALRDRLAERLRSALPDLVAHGDPEHRLPNTLNVALPGVDAGLLLTRLGDELGASAGAACHADSVEPSHVLSAMGIPVSEAMSTVRLSLGRFTTEEEVDRGAERLVQVVRELRGGDARGGEGAARLAGAVRLTQYTHGLGCACKLQPQVLEKVLAGLPAPSNPEVLVGKEGSDDACAWSLGDGRVLVQTLDFFTPIVDSPRLFGAIAAANALSDVYAMGAEPLFALNIVAFPVATLDVSVLEAILAGAQEVAEEAGIPVLGGHTVEDNEPKFGWVVTGVAEEPRLWRNKGARPGDALVLTKPLGNGLWATAAKHGVAPAEGWERAQQIMRSLNRSAARLLAAVAPNAVTDVTGFGFLGHLHEMLAASGVDAEIRVSDVPVIDGTRRLISLGEIPGGTRANLEHASTWTRFDAHVDQASRWILADAQTSGGLLAAVAPDRLDGLLAAAREQDILCVAVGRVLAPGEGTIRVRSS